MIEELETKLCETNERLKEIFRNHKNVCSWNSSGKDSTAMLHILRPWNNRVTLLHNKTDGGWPGSTENLLDLAEAWGFKPPIITQPQLSFDDYVEQYGYQAEIIPTEYDTLVQPPSPFQTEGIRVSSWWHCTLTRQIYPLIQATIEMGADAVLTGSRASDAPAFALMGGSTDIAKDLLGFTRYNPLAEWTTEEVFSYIDALQIPLPLHYKWKRESGDKYEFPDCLRCTWQPEHWRLLREHYPDVYAEHWPETKRVYEALAVKQWDYTKRIMRVVMEGP